MSQAATTKPRFLPFSFSLSTFLSPFLSPAVATSSRKWISNRSMGSNQQPFRVSANANRIDTAPEPRCRGSGIYFAWKRLSIPFLFPFLSSYAPPRCSQRERELYLWTRRIEWTWGEHLGICETFVRFIRSRFATFGRPLGYLETVRVGRDRLGMHDKKIPKEKGEDWRVKRRYWIPWYSIHSSCACVLATAFSHRRKCDIQSQGKYGMRERDEGGAAARRFEIRARNCIGGTVCTAELSCRLLSPVSEKRIPSKGDFVIESLLLPLALRVRINDCRRNERTFHLGTASIAIR